MALLFLSFSSFCLLCFAKQLRFFVAFTTRLRVAKHFPSNHRCGKRFAVGLPRVNPWRANANFKFDYFDLVWCAENKNAATVCFFFCFLFVNSQMVTKPLTTDAQLTCWKLDMFGTKMILFFFPRSGCVKVDVFG